MDMPKPRVKGRATTLDAIVGRNIRRLRHAAGLTQRALAAHLAVSVQQVQKYETGENRLPLERLYRLRALFDVSYDDFLEEAALHPAAPPPTMAAICGLTEGERRI